MTTTISTDKARQGRGGRQVLYVLIAALILTCAAWAIAETYGEKIDNTPQSQGQSTSVPAS